MIQEFFQSVLDSTWNTLPVAAKVAIYSFVVGAVVYGINQIKLKKTGTKA